MPVQMTTCQQWFDANGRRALELLLKDDYLPNQRWFAAKSRTLTRLTIFDHVWCAFDDDVLLWLFVDLTFEDAGGQRYSIPLAFLDAESGNALQAERSAAWVGRFETQDGPVHAVDALSMDGACRDFLLGIASDVQLPTAHGTLRCWSTNALALPREAAAELPIIRPAQQFSNTNITYGNRYVLKLIRRMEPGPNPDLEVGQYLLKHTQFRHVPPLAGAIEYERPGEAPSVLGILTGFVPSEANGWEDVQQHLAAYFNRGDGDASLYVGHAEVLGRRTAELHMALAHDSADPDFQPEAMTAADLQTLVERVEEHAIDVVPMLESQANRLPAEASTLASAFIACRAELFAKVERLADIRDLPLKIRCHGDYHLGQVLLANGDFFILDFEGEPTRPLAERRAKQSALKDVAGMIRSFSYAPYAALHEIDKERGSTRDIEHLAERWYQQVATAFLKSYRTAVNGTALVPASDIEFKRLLTLFLIDKAVYELHYELNNRPDWAIIPLRGIAALIG